MIKFFRKKVFNKGYSLMEMLIYISILTVFSVTMIYSITSFSKSYRNLIALRTVDNSAIDSMERMTRDIRAASSIDIVNSTLGSNPGVLTIISSNSGQSTTTKFYLSNNVLKMDVNGVYFGPLSTSDSSVTNLVFTKIISGASNAVKIDMTVQATVGTIVKTKTFHSTVILRGS